MENETLRYGPVVIVSKDGNRGLELSRYDGAGRITNRDAYGFYFTVRGAPSGVQSRVCVVFDGMARLWMKPSVYGLPDNGGEVTAFVHFSEAAIGESLDRGELLELPSDGSVATVECLSPCQEQWQVRAASDDDAIEEYIKNRLFWSWRFDHDKAVFTSPDFLRLGVSPARFLRIAELGGGTLWSIDRQTSSEARLKPSKPLLTEERARRKASNQQPLVQPQRTETTYVDTGRLQELRDISNANFDLRRLVALCEELNACAANGCLHATAMLTRAIIDHVPPIFGAKTFNEVASNHGGGKSFRESMVHLSNSARKIADSHLHTQIRTKEVLPTRTQVDFSRDLDVLLGEIVRIL